MKRSKKKKLWREKQAGPQVDVQPSQCGPTWIGAIKWACTGAVVGAISGVIIAWAGGLRW